MVDYNLKAMFVKYYREQVADYLTKFYHDFANTHDQTIYIKMTITAQGSLGWVFDNDTTEKTLSVNANTVSQVETTIKAPSGISETQKDQITILVEYFKDSGYTQKFGEDTLIVTIHCYIQNSDGTWTSTAYPNESDIIFDHIIFDSLPESAETMPNPFFIEGVNGNARFYVEHSGIDDYIKYYKLQGSIDTYSGRFNCYGKGSSGSSHIYAYFRWQDIEGNPLTEKFISFVAYALKVISKTNTFHLKYLTDSNTILSYMNAIKKVYVYDSEHTYLRTYASDEGATGVEFDGFYIFNPLP